jgi:hypothetical protein
VVIRAKVLEHDSEPQLRRHDVRHLVEEPDHEAEEAPEEERDDLVARERRREYADRRVRGSEENGADVSANNRTPPNDTVGRRQIAMSVTAAKNLPTIMSRNLSGRVRSISYDPALTSSEKRCIVIAGTIKKNMMGSIPKKYLIDAWFIAKKLLRKKKKKADITTKSPMTMYAIGDMK